MKTPYEPKLRDVVAWCKNTVDEYTVINYDGRRKKPWLVRNEAESSEVWVAAGELVFRRRPL